jgi:hypothetical protein
LKDYLYLPLLAAFGPNMIVLRLGSMLLGALGIWGLGRLIGEHVSPVAGGLVALILAVNPSYINMMAFDYGGFPVWMGAFGMLCWAVGRYPRAHTPWGAFWIGVACGLGVWARANFVWLLAAVFGAALIVWGKRVLAPISHWMALIIGGIVGGAPFLAYEVRSRGGTWEALGMFQANEPFGHRLLARLVMFSETLMADREHRVIWGGPAMPDWEVWLFPAVVLGCSVACLAVRNRLWARACALSFLFLNAPLFFSRLAVSEHHLVVLFPLAAVVVVLGLGIVRIRWLSIALALLYAGSALYWQTLEIEGLSMTGGVGLWSDSIYSLAEYLEEKYPGREVKILDWGLQNNLFVLTEGRLRTREVFGDPHPPWTEEIRQGGVFLLNGADHRQFPAASEEFLKALDSSHVPARHFVVRQENGASYADIIDIDASHN